MRKPTSLLSLVLILLLLPGAALAQESLSETSLPGLRLRSIGPAINGGRIADIDIHPRNENIMYVAVGSGGVWKTENAGTTWDPIFDDQGSYSIGDLAIDPSAPDIIWVGTGENVGGRHAGFGDGIYRSEDGGRTWQNMGLEESEHLSTIVVHPEDSDIVWVAAQGPLWSPGGQRGLYRTTDGGETWSKVLGEGEWTGATDVVIDPRNPDRLYAATWDRHRTVAAYMGGGPGSGIWKSEDGGDTWERLRTGLPDGPLGKIGLALSPQRPDYVYAAIETIRTEGGVWMSEDRGESWRKMSDAVAGGTGPHYYQELYASPHRFGRLFLVSNTTLYSDDHFATYQGIDNTAKHVDDHAIAFRKSDPNYIIFGSDGGLYETFDDMESWRFVSNLPVMQYYKISVDDALPFYNVYGGTQDNGSNGGPTRTAYDHGIRNADWFKTLGADGHESATEPGNPDIVYASTQQGGIHRIDRITGEQVFIQPQAGEGEPFERFNWDAPLEVSFHSPTRLYHASYRVWRSDDRGNRWTPISGDLTRSQERIELPIMGRTQSWDAAWDVDAMSNYNTITSLGESPLDEDLIYAGTDDGLLWVTGDGGESWRRIEVGSIDGVPATAFVNDIKADHHDPSTVYVALDNHKYGDYSPYLVKSTDRGQSWTSMAGNLPDRHLVWRVVQDHVDPDLLFAATEFGLFFTVDGGGEWTEIGGAPTISFRDVVIQRDREDVVAASFGRGIFVLDDYTPLREAADGLTGEAVLFDTRPALWYDEKDVQDSQGRSQYTADNPPFGAVFSYWLRDGYRSLEAERQQREAGIEAGEDVPFPGWDALEAEMREQGPRVQVVIRDAAGNVVNRVNGPTSAGLHRVAWDLEVASSAQIALEERDGFPGGGFWAMPGTYTASLVKVDAGEVTGLAGPVELEVAPLYQGALERASPAEVASFREELEAFRLAATRTSNTLREQIDKVEAMQTALSRADDPEPSLYDRLYQARLELLELRERLQGSEAKREVGERGPPTPMSRLFVGFRGLSTTYGPTEMHRQTVAAGQAELAPIRAEIRRYADEVVPELMRAVEATGAPPIEGGG
ncbi:MAG: VPS10 domain-containing protein [Candidatus Longimicrobiales bacterium M2_2A_002]